MKSVPTPPPQQKAGYLIREHPHKTNQVELHEPLRLNDSN